MRTARLSLAFACLIAPLTGVAAQNTSAPEFEAEAAPESRTILVMLRMPAPHFRPNARYGGSYDNRAAQAARWRVADAIARENGLELVEGWPMPLIGVDCYVMRVPESRTIDSVIQAVSRHSMVAWSQPLQSYQTLAVPARNDPLFPVQPAALEWQLAKLHDLATGRGVKVAVIDSKIEVNHPDLAGQFAESRDFLPDRSAAPEDHGTAVAGVIAAKPGNGLGIVGVAPGARLMALRACFERSGAKGREAGTCDTLTVAKALHFAVERDADVINMSFSGPSDRLLGSLIQMGLKRKIAVVAAFDPDRPGGGFPASLSGVISVAQESLSSVPGRVYRAPGQDIPTTQSGGRWYLVNGSSFAAAHVAGLLALVREERGASAAPARIARLPNGAVDACATLAPFGGKCD